MSLFSWILARGRKNELERRGPQSGRRRRTGESQTMRMRQPVSRRLLPSLLVLGVWLVCAFAAIYRTQRALPDLDLGQKAPLGISARADFTYVDQEQTAAARAVVARQVPDYYRRDIAAKDETQRDLDRLISLATGTAVTPAASSEDEALRRLVQELSREQRDALALLFDTQDKQEFVRTTLNDMLLEGVLPPSLAEVSRQAAEVCIVDEYGHVVTQTTERLRIPAEVATGLLQQLVARFPMALGSHQDTLAHQVLARLIYPTLKPQPTLRREAERKAMAPVEVRRQLRQGELLISKGQVVGEQELAMLKAHAEAVAANRDLGQQVRRDLGSLVLRLLVLVAAAFCLAHLVPQLAERRAHQGLVALIAVLSVLAVWGTFEVLLLQPTISPVWLYPGLPVTLGALLLALLLGKQAGLVGALFLPVLTAFVGDDPYHLYLLGLIGSSVGVLAIHKSRTRIHTFRAALYVLAATMAVEALQLFMRGSPAGHYLQVLLALAATAFVTVLVVNLLLPPCEYFFGVTTNLSLLELSDLNHPLLKRLQLEAPGTYHHTLMVATLAEHAAEAVGANTLLTRVACYFHDIGKLANPTYFTENSFGQDRHEELSPRMSSLIILNHVKEGLAMAAKYKLKEPIREAIATHHGTSLVYYFYRRALDNNQINDATEEENFRYPGPTPQSREASIICLADSCEAASRSLEKPTPQKIDALVSEIFHHKLMTGQLDHSRLTMAELNTVVETIKKTLQTMLHGRISYPKFAAADLGESPKRMASRRPRPPEANPAAQPDAEPPVPPSAAGGPGDGEPGEPAGDRQGQ
jgi:putative nucleotidyltransferase with HDIG domain